MWEPIVLGCLAGGATIAGVLVVRAWQTQALRYSHHVNSFAAGLLLATALVALLPDAQELNEVAPLYALAGFVAFLILETFLVMHSGAELHYARSATRAARAAVFFWGLFLHSLLDGLVITVTYATAPRIGLVTALAVIAHEFPEGVTSFSLLIEKMRPGRAMALSLAVSVATPAGVLAGLPVLRAVRPQLMGAALAVVAGSFLYLAASDIVPEMREENAIWNTAFLIAGVLFLLALHRFLGH